MIYAVQIGADLWVELRRPAEKTPFPADHYYLANAWQLVAGQHIDYAVSSNRGREDHATGRLSAHLADDRGVAARGMRAHGYPQDYPCLDYP